jgi:hypothetical protein
MPIFSATKVAIATFFIFVTLLRKINLAALFPAFQCQYEWQLISSTINKNPILKAFLLT